MLEIGRCGLYAKGICYFGCWRLQAYLITPVLSKIFETIVIGKLSNFLESSSIFPPSHFSYRRGLEICDALLTLSHRLQVALDRGME